MSNAIRTKICGISRPEDVDAVVAAGASYVGFVFFPKSPRNVSPETARELALRVPPGVAKVALVVNPSDEMLDQIVDKVPLDLLQLHGSESPQRVAEIKQSYGLPVMKAIGIAEESDLPKIALYSRVADQLLVDAKPQGNADLPGGNGMAFDWRLLAGRRWAVPWMLAGGLTADNVALAIELTGARQVDASSSMESAPGIKDADKIAAFVAAAQRGNGH
ncbi:MAG: phosphoribosylanthranilate isomerase [Brevirhabdus sp.]